MEKIVFPFFIILYSIYMIFLLTKLGLSYDEPYSMYTSANKLTEVIRLAYQFEFQPPGYFLILALWRKINDGIFFARLLSLVFTFLSAFFLFKASRIIFNRIFSKWIIVLFLLNPFTIYCSSEIRLYSMLVLLTVLAFYLFYLIYFQNRSQLRLLFVLVSTIGVYTQYFFVFLIISFGVILFLRKEWHSFFNYILLSLLIALLFIPNLFFLKEQMNVTPNTLVEYHFSDRVKSVILFSADFFVLNPGFEVSRAVRWALRIVFISFYLISYYKFFLLHKSGKSQDFIHFCYLNLITLTLILIFIFSFSFTNIPLAIRYVTILFPFHILLLVEIGIYTNIIRNLMYGIYAAFLILNIVLTVKPPFIKSYDFKSVAGYCSEIQIDNEPILFLNNDLTLGMKHIYEKSETFISLPEFKYDYSLYTNYVNDTMELNQLINNIKSDSKTFLIITGTDLGYLRNKDLTNEMIDKYLNKNYIVRTDTTFEGYYKEDYVRIRSIIKINQ